MSPSSKLEIFALLNALLVQFSAKNGYAFKLSHDISTDGDDEISVGMKFPGEESEYIHFDMKAQDDEISERFIAARSQIANYKKGTR